MRAAAILGLGCSPKSVKPFQDVPGISWLLGMPGAADQVDVILLFGGDGTIHRHLSELVKLQLPILIVPVGSGNDFARALGLRHVRDSLAAWRAFRSDKANLRTVDLGMITALEAAGETPSTVAQGRSAPHQSVSNSPPASRYFCCVAGLGLDTEVARRANELPRWLRSHGGYALILIPMIFRFAPLPMKVLTPSDVRNLTRATNEESWETRSDQPTVLAAFANTSTYGGGMKIAPQAKIDDALLDVCVVGGIDPFKLFCMFPTVYYGRHLSIRKVDYFQASRLRVETEHPLDVYADGEFVCRTPIEISVQPRALKVIALP